MAVAYNHVVIIGVLTRDPTIKTVGPSATKLANLCVCVNEKRKTPDGTVLDNPVFIDVDAWSKLADMCEKYLVKHSLVFVDGSLVLAQWEKDGVKHQKIKIRARNIKFLNRPDKHGDSGQWKSREVAAHQRVPRAEEFDDEQFIPNGGPTSIDGPDQLIDENFEAAMRDW